MTLSALAEQAGVAKSTVSLIERGQGNPSIDTVWAIATALGIPFTSLFHDEPSFDDVSVVREDDGSAIAVDRAGIERGGLAVRRLLTRTGGALIEIYTLVFDEGTVQHAEAHAVGLFEHIIVAAGRIEISSDSFNEVLGPGDLISFRADRPHAYHVLDGPVRLVSVHEYPQRSEA
jgi:transcriptional regulator with XRE-family HTH domain